MNQHFHFLSEPPTATSCQSVLENIGIFIRSDNPWVQRVTVQWAFQTVARSGDVPVETKLMLLELLRELQAPGLSSKILDWYRTAEAPLRLPLLEWLVSLQSQQASPRVAMVHELISDYLNAKTPDPILITALIRLDLHQGIVTETLLNAFPGKIVDHNHRMIDLLGKLGRYRVVKPLISFSQEFPDYIKTVIKALSALNYDEVDQFYLNCLSKTYRKQPIVILEAVKQVRKRRLKKAMILLDELFPMEESHLNLINRAVNGEIALTMASFGAYGWARGKLMTEIILSGLNTKYLKAIEILNLEDAVPLLKAVLLMPETPELSVLQEEAYRVCDKLLQRQVVRS